MAHDPSGAVKDSEVSVDKTEGGFLITQIKQIQGRVFEKLLAQAGVEAFNGAQGRILYILWQSDSIPIVTLAGKTGLAKTTLTGMLDRLEEAGLASRCFDKADRRQIRIVLTEKARVLQTDYERVSRQMTEIFYRGFEDTEIEGFERLLGRILDNLEREEKANG